MFKPEKRRYPRVSGDGLIAIIKTKIYPVADFSVVGMRLAGNIGEIGEELPLVIMPTHGTSVQLNNGIHTTGCVTRQDDGYTCFEFNHPTYDLMKFIVTAESKKLGQDPFMVK